MPRNHQLAASTLRNRNRVTNKTRLKIHRGTLDADALFIPDEDEEKQHFTTLVAGVDAEDANEHHLQQVLSAAHRSHARTTADTTTSSNTQAYIPTPDSTGVIDNYEELYPQNKWLDPHSYVCTSQTVEDSVSNGIAEGFTYYMDERDKEWLDKHNEEARGEGTSAQGAMLPPGSGTRTSSRSAKAKGKEPESVHTAAITEDEFELVMGIFEKVTHDTTEYLHHGLENGMTFPEFSEYQEAFSQPLKPELFSSYAVPSWIPPPPALLQLARAIYPHWKERRLDRKGHRIIPVLNFDEADTLNESYVCFRRRDTKAIRKTRAQQASSSDKLIRLQGELQAALDLATLVMSRETQKKECITQSHDIWQKRMAFADLKRKYPSLKDKVDDELLVDKERPVKKPEAPRITGLKLKTAEAPPVPVRQEVQIRPSDRIKSIRNRVEAHLDKQREKDHHWEDQIDNPYQNLPVPYSSKLFKFITPPGSPKSTTSDDFDSPSSTRNPRAARLRYGRGGRLHVDRREFKKPRVNSLPRSSLFGLGPESDDEVKMEVDDNMPEDPELLERLESRWKFDNDDAPPYGPQGADEENRVLVDDYNVDYLMHTADLFEERDHASLVTDSNIFFAGPDGKPTAVHAFRLGLPPLLRKDANGVLRPISGLPNSIIPPQVLPVYPFPPTAHNMPMPVSMSHQMKPPVGVPQMRISSNGGMRPPSTPATTTTPLHTPTPQPIPAPVPVPSSTNSSGSSSRPALAMPHIDVPKQEPISTPAIQQNGIIHTPQPEPAADSVPVSAPAPAPIPVRPKPPVMTPQQHMGLGVPTNGYHLTPMPMTAATLMNAGFPQVAPGSITQQQMQNLKTAFANMPNANDPASRALLASYMHLAPNAAALNMAMNPGMKLPPGARPMQWPMAAALPRPAPISNGVDAQTNGAVVTGVPNGSIPQAVPIRSPSTNGTRRNGIQINGQHAMSPHLQQAVAAVSPNLAQAASPPRMAVNVTPKMPMASPSG